MVEHLKSYPSAQCGCLVCVSFNFFNEVQMSVNSRTNVSVATLLYIFTVILCILSCYLRAFIYTSIFFPRFSRHPLYACFLFSFFLKCVVPCDRFCCRVPVLSCYLYLVCAISQVTPHTGREHKLYLQHKALQFQLMQSVKAIFVSKMIPALGHRRMPLYSNYRGRGYMGCFMGWCRAIHLRC